MKLNHIFLFIIVFAFSACGDPAGTTQREKPAAADTILPENSIYQLASTWTDHRSQKKALKQFAGNVQVLAMVFTHCAYACPRIVADIKAIEEQVPADKRDKVQFLLISFDTERDTAQRLGQFYKEMGLNGNWTLLHGGEEDVRDVAVLLNMQYEKQSDGNFNHSNIITILDQKGCIQFQQEGLEVGSSEAMKAIHHLID